MIEVPGMTREALGTMSQRETEALRFGLYARAVGPFAAGQVPDARTLDGIETELVDADNPPSPAILKRRRAVGRENIAQARIAQAQLREVLFLDAEDLD